MRYFNFNNSTKSTISRRLSVFTCVILFGILFAGNAWGQAKVTIESEISKSGSLSFEVWGVDDASVSATPVERTSPNGEQVYCAYDIDITKDGREWQPEPEQPAIVTMDGTNFADGQLVDIYHEGANGPEFVATVASENGKITFPAHSFSVYIVAAAGDYARLKVNFHRASGPDVTIYVKKADIEHGDYETILYNPGLGTPADGVYCMGWINNENYASSDIASAITFEQIRATIGERLEAGVNDGDEVDFYAMLFKSHSVKYMAETDAVIYTDVLWYRADASNNELAYRVNAAYTPPDNTHKFEGWRVNSHEDGTHIHNHTDDLRDYTNNTTIRITGDVVFKVHITEGHWLVYHENGKGATYKAADFIPSGQNTQAPSIVMTRKGYTFLGWFLSNPAPANAGDDPNGSAFSFGQPLTDRVDIYAKWAPIERANYTVIFWTQNLQRTGYEVKDSYVGEGRVGGEISYTFNDNGDEDFVTGVSTYGHYKGFCLTEASKNQHISITPEGDAVLNLYYDRIEYYFKFYLYRNGTQNNRYDYANNSGNSADLSGLATWHTNQDAHPGVTASSGYTIESETVGGKTYYYFTIQAYYGEEISSKWPTYDKITGANNRNAVSYIMMVGTKLKPRATNQGSGTVKGIITVMDENILGATNDSYGNYVVVRFPDSYYNWRYHIWFETADGVDYSNMTTRQYDDTTYYEETVLVSRSSNTTDANQNPPVYSGFEFKVRRGESNNDFYGDANWTTGNNPTLYHLNFIYRRQQFKISYFDGNYVDGNGNMIQNRGRHLLHESASIGQGVTIADSYRNYEPDLPDGEDGYVFEGWYIDEGCTVPYTWDKMTVGGIIVYAKWRLIQYRVFLHPNADEVEDLDWGSDNQAMNFRIDFGKKISAPTGIGEDYQFVGWYTNEACTIPFNENDALNETTVTTSYDKTDVLNYTDPMDKWGHITPTTEEPTPRNSDLTGNNGSERWWITKKYDLYGQWRAKLRGANGINVVYIDNEGTGPVPTEDMIYMDNVNAVAGHACAYGDASKEFSHWVMQRYNTSTGNFEDIADSRILPGSTFRVLKSNALRVIRCWYNTTTGDSIVSSSETNPNPALYNDYRANYTVKLRAEYVAVESPKYTSIDWFVNDGTTATERRDENQPINETVLPPVPSRPGYNFKGWYKYSEGGTLPETIDDCDPHFLYYKSSNGAFYEESSFTNVATIAADLHEPIDYMYAIWEPKVEFTFEAVCQGAPIELPLTTTYGVELSASGWTWTATSGTVDGRSYTPSDGASVTLTFNPASSTCAQAKSFDMELKTPNVANPERYDFIWRGGTASHLTDWNTESNWFVYNSNYSIARAVPTSESRIYIGPADCVTSNNWPSQTAEASAKDITIADGASLTVPTGKTLKIYGNLDNIGTLSATDGTVEFCGTSERAANQTISNDITLGNVVFYNQGGDIVPSGNVTINGAATFKDGVVKHDVTFGADASVADAGIMTYNSFVEGKVTKNGNASGFTFPTGQNSVLGKIKATSDAEDVSVQYFHNSRGFTESEMPRWWNINDMCSNNNPQLDHVSNFEYWKVETPLALESILTVSAADGNAHFNTTTTTHDADDIYGAFWSGSCWENIGGGSQYVSVDPYGDISVAVKIPQTRTVYDKIVTLGSKDHNTVLPIELTSFSATCDGRSSYVMWTTATEKNNDYFSLERSDDAINFVEIARIAGAGNSIEPLSYSYTDYGVYGGDNYYRLVQVDYDGTRTASEIIVTNCVEASGEPEVLAYPNPFNSDLTVELENFGDRPASIEVYDLLGRLVYVEKADAPQNSYQTILHLDGLSNSTYTVRVSTADFVINRKVVKD